jgi:3'-5' exoribonuclease
VGEGFVRFRGRSELYQNALQLVADHISVIPSEKVDLADFLARTTKDVGKMFEVVESTVGMIKDPNVKALIYAFLGDRPLMEKFKKAPAAVNCHHNYLGGLLEHTQNMLLSARALLPLYPQVQADLVIAGIFLHDMGKVDELSYDRELAYSDEGQLIGHLVMAISMLEAKLREVEKLSGEPVPEETVLRLKHLIISHHGEYEYGSPKLPMTLEAVALFCLDNLDAKVFAFHQQLCDDPNVESSWTHYNPSMNRKLFKGSGKKNST